ncbi:hypothetical protein [Streptomyces blattellae]|uniref:hypothetical protein n=1 Tax=Streptomyces blattellae TaxID=2569855 RepID=UPI0012B9D5E2|nr:hypothetical protein [Streptomyces blattellae]
MPASEHSAENDRHEARPQQPYDAVPGLSMRDLLASCAAANVISTPPRAPERYETEGRRAA